MGGKTIEAGDPKEKMPRACAVFACTRLSKSVRLAALLVLAGVARAEDTAPQPTNSPTNSPSTSKDDEKEEGFNPNVLIGPIIFGIIMLYVIAVRIRDALRRRRADQDPDSESSLQPGTLPGAQFQMGQIAAAPGQQPPMMMQGGVVSAPVMGAAPVQGGVMAAPIMAAPAQPSPGGAGPIARY